jgi:DNA-binding FrmR family transcriptional regulator
MSIAPEQPLHDHGHRGLDEFPHAHRPEVKKRLARAAGHLEAVRRMVDADRDCPEILRQIAAVRAALDATARVVLSDHMESCLRGAASGKSERALDDLKAALATITL